MPSKSEETHRRAKPKVGNYVAGGLVLLGVATPFIAGPTTGNGALEAGIADVKGGKASAALTDAGWNLKENIGANALPTVALIGGGYAVSKTLSWARRHGLLRGTPI